jgi:hypothetical protein
MARWTDYTEPARIRALVGAVLMLCGALGVVLPFDLPAIAEALIVLLAVAIPVAQGESTRAAVVPLEKHKDQVARAAGHVVIPHTQGVADHAAPTDDPSQ